MFFKPSQPIAIKPVTSPIEKKKPPVKPVKLAADPFLSLFT